MSRASHATRHPPLGATVVDQRDCLDPIAYMLTRQRCFLLIPRMCNDGTRIVHGCIGTQLLMQEAADREVQLQAGMRKTRRSSTWYYQWQHSSVGTMTCRCTCLLLGTGLQKLPPRYL